MWNDLFLKTSFGGENKSQPKTKQVNTTQAQYNQKYTVEYNKDMRTIKMITFNA